jgi:hypothetical protein
VGGGCTVLELSNGDRYAIENLDGFAPGSEVIVSGVFAETAGACAGACAGLADVKGCVEDNDVRSTGPVGEVGFFRRADCNSDGTADLSDAVFGLLHLFSSGEYPLCPEACNSNADDHLDITDPIYTLRYLFAGTQPPPPPFPGCAEAKKRILCGDEYCPCLYPEARCEGVREGR